MRTFPSLGFGLGLRVPHYEAILATRPADVNADKLLKALWHRQRSQGASDQMTDQRYPAVASRLD